MGLITNDTKYPVVTSIDTADEFVMLDGGTTLKKVGAGDLLNFVGTTAPVTDAYTNGVHYIGHRGAPNLYPEETMEGYRATVAAGVKAIEGDCWLLADGSVGVMHDSSVDRTTTASGSTAAQTSGSWAALTVDHGATLGGAFTSTTQRAPFLDDLVREFGNKVTLNLEAKNAGSGAALTAVLQKYNVNTSSVIVTSFIQAELTSATAAGYTTLLVGDGIVDLPGTKANGIDWIGVSTSATSGYIANAIAAGLKVACYTPNRHWQRDQMVGYGVEAFWSDDPVYIARQTPMRTTDPFASNTWYHGHLGGGTTNARGTITGGKLVYPQSSFISVLQGWACPLATPNSITLTLSIDFVTAAAPTNWVSVDLTNNDKSIPTLGAFGTGQVGYRCLFRKNGNVAVYRVTDAGSTLLEIAGGTVTSISDGATATYKITVTATTIKAERTDVANATSAYADATYRNLKYLHFGGDNVAARFHGVTVA